MGKPFTFIDPVHGDITEDVARELNAMIAADDAETFRKAQEHQNRIAAHFRPDTARTFRHGHMVAQIDARVHDYWRRREGNDFWKHELKRFVKKHPECAVNAKTGKTTGFGVTLDLKDKPRITGRGRWSR